MNTEETKETEQAELVPQNNEILVEYKDDESYQTALSSYKNELDKQIAFANDSSDWKEIRKRLSDVRGRIKSLFFKEEDLIPVNELIQSTFDSVNQRQNEELERLDAESQQNYDSIIEQVKESVTFADTNTDYKLAREKLLASQELFKAIRLKRSHRDELYKMINSAFDTVSKRQSDDRENYEMECIDNYHNMKQKIEMAIEFANKSPIFAEARKALINVQNLIKGLKLKRDQRDELYQLIRDTFDKVNTKQEQERNSFESETSENYAIIKKIVDEAIAFAKNSEDFSQSRDRLIEAQSQIKSMRLKRDQRDELYSEIRIVFDDMNKNQSAERETYESECNQNFEKLTEKVNDCFGLVHGLTEFNLIRESLITVQSEVKIARLKKDQRNELFSRIREAFSVFDKKKTEYFDQRKEDKGKKLEDIKSGLIEKIARLSDVLAKDFESLEMQKTKLAESGDDEFLASEIRKKIENIEIRIKEKNDSIEQSKNRIEDITEEISKL